jgi:16S rRNA (uracil1498-N3)-methyltransferase
VHQATEQSRRTSSPEIAEPIKLKELFAIADETRIVLSEVERELTLKDALPPDANSVLLAFGPEGGWTDHELAVFGEAGWASASMGNTILRAETAVIAAVAVVASVLQ